ncbi:MAG: hypothetical protein DRN29_06585 [Thermoplasmata archaeon]|nr:MAG: hypothetical protein DRN29_06585 [Thermoplasmata archaeon]
MSIFAFDFLLLVVVLLELVDPNSIIGNILLLVGYAIALKASIDQTYIFSSLIVFGVLGASITTNGLLGNVFFWDATRAMRMEQYFSFLSFNLLFSIDKIVHN